MNPNHQDWDTVVIRKKAPKQSDLKDESAVNAARRSGAAIESVKKFTAGSNKVNLGTATTTGKSAVKLEQETEDFHRGCPSAVAPACPLAQPRAASDPCPRGRRRARFLLPQAADRPGAHRQEAHAVAARTGEERF